MAQQQQLPKSLASLPTGSGRVEVYSLSPYKAVWLSDSTDYKNFPIFADYVATSPTEFKFGELDRQPPVVQMRHLNGDWVADFPVEWSGAPDDIPTMDIGGDQPSSSGVKQEQKETRMAVHQQGGPVAQLPVPGQVAQGADPHAIIAAQRLRIDALNGQVNNLTAQNTQMTMRLTGLAAKAAIAETATDEKQLVSARADQAQAALADSGRQLMLVTNENKALIIAAGELKQRLDAETRARELAEMLKAHIEQQLKAELQAMLKSNQLAQQAAKDAQTQLHDERQALVAKTTGWTTQAKDLMDRNNAECEAQRAKVAAQAADIARLESLLTSKNNERAAVDTELKQVKDNLAALNLQLQGRQLELNQASLQLADAQTKQRQAERELDELKANRDAIAKAEIKIKQGLEGQLAELKQQNDRLTVENHEVRKSSIQAGDKASAAQELTTRLQSQVASLEAQVQVLNASPTAPTIDQKAAQQHGAYLQSWVNTEDELDLGGEPFYAVPRSELGLVLSRLQQERTRARFIFRDILVHVSKQSLAGMASGLGMAADYLGWKGDVKANVAKSLVALDAKLKQPQQVMMSSGRALLPEVDDTIYLQIAADRIWGQVAATYMGKHYWMAHPLAPQIVAVLERIHQLPKLARRLQAVRSVFGATTHYLKTGDLSLLRYLDEDDEAKNALSLAV
jgi:hypothetical protein